MNKKHIEIQMSQSAFKHAGEPESSNSGTLPLSLHVLPVRSFQLLQQSEDMLVSGAPWMWMFLCSVVNYPDVRMIFLAMCVCLDREHR